MEDYKEKYEELVHNYQDFKEVVIESLDNLKGFEASDYDMGYNTAIEHAIAVVADINVPSIADDYIQPFLLRRLEFELLKHWKYKGYKYIARDRDLTLYVYKDKTTKYEDIWVTENGHARAERDFDDLFCFVEWTDKEPTNIEKLLNECEVVDSD